MKFSKTFQTWATGLAVCSLTLSMPAFSQKKSTLSDAEIASAAVVANQNDIDFAKIAKQIKECRYFKICGNDGQRSPGCD